jgi:ABC-type multidrug transport system permease subunit
MMGAAQPTILTFPSERPVFLREYAARQYGVLPYFVSKTIVELPVVFMASVIMFLIAYWVMGFHGNFLALVCYSWLLGVASSGLSLIVSAGVASVEKAIQLAPMALLPQMLFSGLFIPVDEIPDSLKWVQYLCPLKYAINLMAQAEFYYVKKDLDTGCTESQCPGAYARKDGLEAQSIYWDDWAQDFGALLALTFAFRVLACFVLWRKGTYVF